MAQPYLQTKPGAAFGDIQQAAQLGCWYAMLHSKFIDAGVLNFDFFVKSSTASFKNVALHLGDTKLESTTQIENQATLVSNRGK